MQAECAVRAAQHLTAWIFCNCKPKCHHIAAYRTFDSSADCVLQFAGTRCRAMWTPGSATLQTATASWLPSRMPPTPWCTEETPTTTGAGKPAAPQRIPSLTINHSAHSVSKLQTLRYLNCSPSWCSICCWPETALHCSQELSRFSRAFKDSPVLSDACIVGTCQMLCGPCLGASITEYININSMHVLAYICNLQHTA